MASTPQTVAHVFNDDLLANPADAGKAGVFYPDLAEILEHPDLIALFNRYNAIADAAKARRHRNGLRAVVLGTVSLLAAAVLLVGHNQWLTHLWEAIVSFVAAAAGVVSLGLAVGLFSRSSKHEWLCGRFMTERLRQFHFQMLVVRIQEIVAAAKDDKAKARFLEQRRLWLAKFRDLHEDKLPAELSGAIDPSSDGRAWLHQPPPETGKLDLADPIVQQVLDAYANLRILHQLQYADYKLGHSHGVIPRLPRSQARAFSLASVFCIVLLLFSDIGAAAYGFFDASAHLLCPRWDLPLCPDSKRKLANAPPKPATAQGTAVPSDGEPIKPDGAAGSGPSRTQPENVNPERQANIAQSTSIPTYLHLLALVLAIGVLAVRTLEDGLKPNREVERYTKYRSAIVRVNDRFHDAKTVAAKIDAMLQMERLAYDEMCDFLQTHNEAGFVM